ncbi:hypothetical protein BWQ93_03620 [Sphingopyxis sp. QXT-31]|uniref:hypothetical protein n=1 Tax=Sphingopyxis sp. QXT-31 TaxID=1357916 RepID=UPI0009792877|nr:hypothetical protein [Sphingopyxis sp. QXT-31]APZ97677.1 hypothetical protein BWQ93_03620 [Sphingopyxis sp. QXT-31]
MLKERIAAANEVADKLHQYEKAIDEAIARAGELVSILPQAQASAKLSSVMGDTSFNLLHASVTGLFEGRARVVALHHELTSVKDRMGLRNRIVGVGDLGKTLPPAGTLVEADPILAVDRTATA